MEGEAPESGEPIAPRLPVRASIYIAPDGMVHFGALFEELVPVAASLSTTTPASTTTANSTSNSNSNRRDLDLDHDVDLVAPCTSSPR